MNYEDHTAQTIFDIDAFFKRQRKNIQFFRSYVRAFMI